MSRWDALWYAPVASVRPWLFTRLLLLLLAFDLWILQLPHGGRYGAGGFNAAHVPGLDAIQPMPSPGLYVTLTAVTGGLALWGAIRPSRLVVGLVTAGFTWSWAMSLLDAWQHHYLLSLLLVALALGPMARDPEGRATEGAWAWRLIPATLAIVYAFATVAKLDPVWRSGQALAVAVGPALEAQVAAIGPEVAWPLLAWGAIALESALALGYLLAVGRDQARGRRWDLVFGGFWLLSLLLHGTIEWVGLKIGWFTPYLLICGSALLLPERVLLAAARPAHWLGTEAMKLLPDAGWVPVVAGGLGAIGAVTVGMEADLPGGLVAGVLLAVALVALLAWEQKRGGKSAAIACLLVPLALSTVLERTEARFDFWRWYAGDLRRRGELEASLEAYQRAERHAPPGRSRAESIEQVKKELAGRE